MSNTKIGFLVGGAFVLAGITGAGGFYIGGLSQKLAYLERGMLDQPVAAQPMQTAQYGAAPSVPYAPPIPAAPVAPPPAPVAQLNADGVPVQIAGVLQNQETVSALIGVLDKATAFQVEGELSNERPIYAFFDPRCPYCKRAMQELNGTAKINWIPVSLLGDLQSGSDMIDGMRTLEGQAAIASVSGGSIPKATGTAETQAQLEDNASILFALYEGAPDSVAVPTFFVPRKDGTATFFRGYDPGDNAKLIEAYGS